MRCHLLKPTNPVHCAEEPNILVESTGGWNSSDVLSRLPRLEREQSSPNPQCKVSVPQLLLSIALLNSRLVEIIVSHNL